MLNMIYYLDIGQAVKSAPVSKGVDLEAQGVINGVPTLDFDLQDIKDEDKPWRKPGADITDYFNYGFNEDTWIQYCMKQKRLRAENSANKVPGLLGPPGAALAVTSILPTPNMPPNINTLPLNIPPNQVQAAPTGYMPKQQPFPPRPILLQQPQMQQQQPLRKIGQIDVIGSTDSTSRRPQYEHDMNQISVLGSNNL